MRSGLVRKNQEELKERKKQVERSKKKERSKKSKEKDEEKEEKEMKGSPEIDKIESSSDEEYSCDDSECDEPECEENKIKKKCFIKKRNTIESSSDEEYSCDDSECDEPECEEKKKLKKNVKKTLIDFRKFTKKNQYSLIEIFGKIEPLYLYIEKKTDFLNKYKSQLESCTVLDCDNIHKMRQIYIRCQCSDKCKLSFKIKQCLMVGRCELYQHINALNCKSKTTDLRSYTSKLKEKRGISKFIKTEILALMKLDPDIGAKRTRKILITNRKKKEEEGERVYDEYHIPKLTKICNWMRRQKKANYNNTISQMIEKIKNNQYKDSLKEDDYFFFNSQTKLGEGTKSSPVQIMMTSKSLMKNCNYLNDGVLQIDGTYRLTKNNYPWIICGVVDRQGKLHPIAFMISNQETILEFKALLTGIINLAYKLDINCDPDFIMMDSSDATHNAVSEIFPNATILMCYFHVMKNIKKYCQKPLTNSQYESLLVDIRYLHLRKTKEEFEKGLTVFKKKWNTNSTHSIYEYCSTWFKGKWSKWQIFHSPPGWSSTNSNIESFNATIKRDFSLRRRYTVFGSVNVIKDIITYYSTNKEEFCCYPRFNQKTHERGKHYMAAKYKKNGVFQVSVMDKYIINIQNRKCSCRWFLKNAVCEHILGYCYKTKYDQECWFGPKYTGEPTNFAFNVKRGAKTKKIGRYKYSEKALDPY